MFQICRTDEIAIHLLDAARSEGLLATIQTWGIAILAHCCVPAQQGALALVVTDKPELAKAGLERAGLPCKTGPVVLVRTHPHPVIAAQLGMRLTAAQIGICYCYTSWLDAPEMHVVFKTTDDDQAMRVLRACAASQNQDEEFQLLEPN